MLKINQVAYFYQANAGTVSPVSNSKTAHPTRQDKVEVTFNSKDFKGCIEKAKDGDEGRQAKIEAIKARLAAGEYDLSPEQLAAEMLKNGFRIQ